MRRFGYVFDPLFIGCCGLYALNRWVIKPHTHIVFFHSWFSDIWLIPCALPPLLLLERWLNLRTHDDPPTAGEVLSHLIGWSILFELIGPHIMRTVGDPWDAVAYAVGAAIAWVWWHYVHFFKNGFDRLAPYYVWMEPLLAGMKMQQCRTVFLDDIPPPRRALLLGEGNGRFASVLLQKFPDVRCVCVDASAKMLEISRRRIPSDRVEFICADATTWRPNEERIDLIVTNFFLDCFTPEQLDRLIPKIAAVASTDARWLVADFQIPARGLARWRARAILALMYTFFRWAADLPAERLTDPAPFLGKAGFTMRERREMDWGLMHATLWQRRSQPPEANSGNNVIPPSTNSVTPCT